MVSKTVVETCLTLIIESKFSEAREMVLQTFENTTSERTRGARFAIEGIISKFSGKGDQSLDLGHNAARLRTVINRKISSVWSDDFDKGYFSVWKEFIKLLTKSGHIGTQKSVVKNPRKEEQHDETP